MIHLIEERLAAYHDPGFRLISCCKAVDEFYRETLCRYCISLTEPSMRRGDLCPECGKSKLVNHHIEHVPVGMSASMGVGDGGDIYEVRSDNPSLTHTRKVYLECRKCFWRSP